VVNLCASEFKVGLLFGVLAVWNVEEESPVIV
jgi:hypothetical protein